MRAGDIWRGVCAVASLGLFIGLKAAGELPSWSWWWVLFPDIPNVIWLALHWGWCVR